MTGAPADLSVMIPVGTKVEARYKAVDVDFNVQVQKLRAQGAGRDLDALLERLNASHLRTRRNTIGRAIE